MHSKVGSFSWQVLSRQQTTVFSAHKTSPELQTVALFIGHKKFPPKQTQQDPLELLELDEVKNPQVIDGSSPLHIPPLQQEIVFPPVPLHSTDPDVQLATLPSGQNKVPLKHVQQKPLELELELELDELVEGVQTGLLTPRVVPHKPACVQHSAIAPVQINMLVEGSHLGV